MNGFAYSHYTFGTKRLFRNVTFKDKLHSRTQALRSRAGPVRRKRVPDG
jgi:hypothetical protein